MKITYQSINLELPYPVVQIVNVKMQEGLNRHACLQVMAVIEEEKINKYFYQIAEGEQIKAGYNGEEQVLFFVGYLDQVEVFYEKGQAMLMMLAVSVTKKWDVVKRKRSFQNLDASYADIISMVLSGYEKTAWVSKTETSRKVPGLILQYNETDWEFLCRLASHFAAFIMVAASNDIGQIYFGIPEINYNHNIKSNNYAIVQDMQRYQNYTQNTAAELMAQDNLGWKITDRASYKLGEQVMWKQVACQVTGVLLETRADEIWYTYHLERTAGVKSNFYGNQEVSGLSLPATIKERNGNCLRVHFSIDPVYKAENNAYYTFAIETTSWYCLPEVDSVVHIYFQNWDETSAIAIHAMRTAGAKSASSTAKKSVSEQGAVGDKSFSTSEGTAMKLTETGIIFDSDESRASTVTLSKDGSLNVDGKIIIISSPVKLKLGNAKICNGKDTTEVVAKNLIMECESGAVVIGIVEFGEEEVTLQTDKGIALNEDGSVYLIASQCLDYKGEKKDPPGVQYSDADLKAKDKEQRDAHNQEVFQVKERASKSKFGVGTAIAVAGLVIAAGAMTVLSGGFAAPAAVALVAGGVAALCGAAQMDEALLDMSKMESGDFSQSYNAIRDGVFQGNQDLYNTVMYGSIMIGASLLLAPVAATWKLNFLGKMFFQGLSTGLLSTSTGLLVDVTDGFVDGSWQDYGMHFVKTGSIAMMSFGIAAGFTKVLSSVKPVEQLLNKTGKFSPALIIGAETLLDMGVEYVGSRIQGTEYEIGKSFISNLATNIVFSVDPVDMATGGFCLETTDISLPDLMDGEFRFQRFHNSCVPCKGGMGKRWRHNLESRLFLHGNQESVDVLCVDGHIEQFALYENYYVNQRQGDKRYQLNKLPEDTGFVLKYLPEHKEYYYDSMGRLLSIKGKGKGCLSIQYQGAHIGRVITSAGYVLEFFYDEDRIVEIRDESGRTIRYKYDVNEYLTAVCHVDEGVTTYHYDDHHNITQIIDQNGHTYVRNEYDNNGRVAVQHYLDGTRSLLEYNSEKKENTVHIEALGRTEKYGYNRDSLITHMTYDDGTVSEIGYDEWSNKIYEKDRNGNVTVRKYNVYGNIVREELPSGQIWEYEYNKTQNLIEKQANTGQKCRFQYNEAGFLKGESEKIREGIWRQRQYERDSFGRVIKETDSRGNSKIYAYKMNERHLLTEPSQITDESGNKTAYEYDITGRRLSISTAHGTAEFRYNKQNYETYVRDANGNETRRTYDKIGNLTAMFPPNQENGGHAWMFQYDYFDRVIETRDPLGNVWKKERNLAGDITREIHPCGYADDGDEGYGTRYDYDTNSRKIRTIYPNGSVERCFYDGNGNLVKKVRPENYDAKLDDGKGTCYRYDSMNRLKQIIAEDGSTRNRFTYNNAGNLTEETDAAGYTTYHAYDLVGKRTTTWQPVEKNMEETLYSITVFEYDKESNLICEKRGRDKVLKGCYPIRYHELLFSYDGLNRLCGIKDKYGAKATFQYDGLNRKVYERFLISADVEKSICYEYDAAGRLIEKREGIEERFVKPNGTEKTIWATTRFEYDKNGNCIKIVTPKGYRKEFGYDELDRVIKSEEKDKQGGIHRIYRYEYDSASNLVSRQDESLNTSVKSRQYQYDKKDRLTHFIDESGAVTRLFYDRNDRISKVIRPEQYQKDTDDGAGTSYQYNYQDQIVSITGPDNMIMNEYTYDAAGNRLSERKGQFTYQEYEHDIAGRVVAFYPGKERAVNKQPAQKFTYDAQGNIIGVEDGNRNHTQFALDDWGRITEIYTPEGGIERFTYNYAGNITSTTDANGGTIRYCYNNLGQIHEIADQEGTSEFFYYDVEGRPELHVDRNGNRVRTHYNMDNQMLYQRAADAKEKNAVTNQYSYYPNGSLKEVAGGGMIYHYDYTAAGLLKERSSNGRPLLTYSYDKNRNLKEMIDAVGNVTAYTYDSLNRMHQVGTGNMEAPLAVYEYTPDGQVDSLHYQNGVKTSYTYQDDGQMESLVATTADGKILLNYEYAYDGNGNCIQKYGERYQNEYSYDKMNRLTAAVCNGVSEWFDYDKAGNRLRRSKEGCAENYQYNVKNQLIRLKKDGDEISYSYDRQGNLVSEEGRDGICSRSYDSLNRMCQVAARDVLQENKYDGEHLRYETVEMGKRIRFLFDRGELVANTVDEIQSYYVRGQQVIAAKAMDEDDFHYFVADEMGSTTFILDAGQNIKNSYRYDAFGSIIETTGESDNRITYTGQIYDSVSQQYYLRARFYNPAIGRFVQEDAYRGDGLNLYAYCRNNPVIYFDPTGYFGLCPRGKTNSFSDEQYKKRINQTPAEGRRGSWTGERGESMYIPTDSKMKELLAQYGLEGVSYKDGVPDFSPFSYGTVDIFNMHGGMSGRDFNFASAYKELSTQTGISVNELMDINGLTWHELNNMRTMQLIPTDINKYFGHTGGVGEINLYFNFFGY